MMLALGAHKTDEAQTMIDENIEKVLSANDVPCADTMIGDGICNEECRGCPSFWTRGGRWEGLEINRHTIDVFGIFDLGDCEECEDNTEWKDNEGHTCQDYMR